MVHRSQNIYEDKSYLDNISSTNYLKMLLTLIKSTDKTEEGFRHELGFRCMEI